MWTHSGSILIAHIHMNVEIVTEAAQFPEKERITGIFVAVWFTLSLCSLVFSGHEASNVKLRILE
jgi:hypothetical protein